MTVGELRKALETYPDDATMVVCVSVPDLYINAVAHGSITGNALNPEECTKVQFLAQIPSRFPFTVGMKNADTNQQGAVQEG